MKEIQLTRGFTAKVDDRDYELLNHYKWHLHTGRGNLAYAARSLVHRNYRYLLMMHRAVLNPPPKYQVDHIDGDGLNNQRANLRFATYVTNQHNRKGNRPALAITVVPRPIGGKTHCEKGHPFSGDNLSIEKGSGRKRCKICRNEKHRRWVKSISALLLIISFYAPPQPQEPILIDGPHQPAPACAGPCEGGN